ncbi:uncharacterized protein LOC113340851 [Papaver somniferum]|uniref:uncharacterized protein LOC113340851 n=1 Tax=Papaver somniferum TaxID=3469 RepID=UPI000E6FEB59|nr:uncharacterized protein LOC113340851 [Papaver somniferum]
MARFGFRITWRNWIRWCLSSTRFAMDINGSASPLFRSSKGIKQGDPMYHFLFMMVVEVLSILIKKAAALKLLSGFKVGSAELEINHLQFADDLIVLLDDDSAVVAVGNAEHVDDSALIFGYSMTTFPMKYLGIPLGSTSKSVGVWDVILQKFQKKLSVCQRKYLSKGGRLMLIQNVLCSLPIYYLSLFQMPASVEKKKWR